MSTSDISNCLVVVGDKFSTFGSLPGAITVAKLASRIEQATSNGELPSRVLVGQGVSESWLVYMEARAAERGAEVSFIGERRVSDRAGRQLSHKHQRRNVLITRPERSGEKRFSMQLSVDDDCEIMSDHTTGHHLQGMVLIEAARQAFLAVTERFLLNGNEPFYFVIDRMNITFSKFVFPVRTDIDFELIDFDTRRDDRVRASAVIRFMQCGELACEVHVGYTAIEDKCLSPREAKLAQTALGHILAAQRSGPANTVTGECPLTAARAGTNPTSAHKEATLS